jgi:polar amino acid transport system substrate-binding protein
MRNGEIKMKKIFIIFTLVFSMLLSGCGEVEGLLNEKYLVVATSPDYAPYEFIDASKTGIDKFVGADVELMKFIAKELGVELKIEEMYFDASFIAVQTRKVDIAITGVSWTPTRAGNYELSDSYFGSGDGFQQVLILEKNKDKFNSINSLNKKGVKVAAQSGSLQEDLLDEFLPSSTKELVNDLDLAVSMLIAEKIDALVISEYAASVKTTKNNSLSIIDENFDIPEVGSVVVVKKGNIVLLDKINAAIKKAVDQDLYSKWMEEAIALAANLGIDIN